MGWVVCTFFSPHSYMLVNVWRANCGSSVNKRVSQSDTIQSNFIHTTWILLWIAKLEQTHSRHIGVNPLVCTLRPTEVANIFLQINGTNIDVTRVEVTLPFFYISAAIDWSSVWIVYLRQMFASLWTPVLAVRICFHNHEITKQWTPKERATSLIDSLALTPCLYNIFKRNFLEMELFSL